MIIRLVAALLALSAPVLGAPSPNLLSNGGFELRQAVEGSPDGWESNPAPGSPIQADAAVAHSGKASCRIAVPGSAPVSWYTAYRGVGPIRRGAYTMSAWVRTRDVAAGTGAYISLNCFNGAGTRLAYFDSTAKVSGTSDWRRLTTTARIPDGTSELRAILCVHGHGTAWFDDVQVEEGEAATSFQPALADTEVLAARESEARATAEWVRQLPARKPGQARIAILDERFPTGPSAPSDPAVLAAALAGAGYSVARIGADRLENASFLDPATFDLLLLPSGDAFPARAHRALVNYLRRGGSFLSTGGYAFDRPLVRFDGKWYAPEALPAGDGPTTPLFGDRRPQTTDHRPETAGQGGKEAVALSTGTGVDRSLAGWETHSSRPEGPSIRPAEGPNGTRAVEVYTPGLQAWDTALSPTVEGKLPAGWSVTRFWARGDARTPTLAIEWHEADGSRWKKNIPLTQEWKEYALFATDFAYWHDNPSVGRGGEGDHFRPANARRMLFGLATDIAERSVPHTFWVADIRVQADAAGDLRMLAPRVNTRWARIRDAMWPAAEQIGAFDPGFPLRNVAVTRPASGQAIAGAFSLKAPLSGYSATAMLGLNGHGFGPNRARWIPLLECVDACNRPRGHAGAVIHHFAGTFTGSSWAVFGAGDRDLFAAGSPALRGVLIPTVAHLLRRLYLHETDTAYACYRAGESVSLRTRVSDYGQRERQVQVRFVVTPEGAPKPAATLTRELALKPGETASVEMPWKPTRFTSDTYTVVAELWVDGQRIDREENAFVVWSPALLVKGPSLKQQGSRFRLEGRSQFLMGCQTYWGQNGSVTARSPAAFARDFRQMRDLGLRWTRCFIPFKTEEDKRISDAIVQLAQKYGIVLYHTPNLSNTADPEQLAAERATSREIAERYRGVPGLAVDICNEPSFHADDPGLRKAFGREGKTTGKWDDLDAAAFWRCMTDAQRAWARGNCESVHEGDATRLTSVGWSQGWAGGPSMKDPILASLDLDFTDRHYYGRPLGLDAELRDVDLRGLGKPLVLGECGAKDHPTFKATDPWGMGDDDASYDRRFLTLGHHAFGLGASVLSSWHLRDPMEGIFPCGIVHQTNVPRPTAFAMRAMSLAFGRLKPKPVVPTVYLILPDAGRMGGQREEVIRAFHRASDLLVASRVDFGLLPDSALDRIPAGTRALVYPVPLDPADEVVQRLERFVQAGGALYLSGDLSYDAQRKPTKRDRLARLCGVEWRSGQGEGSPLALVPVGGQSEPVPGSGLEAWEARPVLRVKPAGAEVLAACAGAPVVTRFRLGAGQAWLNVDPVELAPQAAPAHRALYGAFLRAAGAPVVAAQPDRGDLYVFHVPGEDADAWVLHNTGAATDAKVGGFTLALAEGGFGYLLVGRDGTLRAVEAQGVVRRGGKEIARIQGHAFLIATDDRDLAQSRSLLVLPLEAGEVRIAGSSAKIQAEVGELRGGGWATLASLAVKPAAGQIVIPIAPAHRREMIRVTVP